MINENNINKGVNNMNRYKQIRNELEVYALDLLQEKEIMKGIHKNLYYFTVGSLEFVMNHMGVEIPMHFVYEGDIDAYHVYYNPRA